MTSAPSTRMEYARSNLESSRKKVVGEPDEGKPHVRFDVAGDENQDRVKVLRHSQKKWRATGCLHLRLRRHPLTLPADLPPAARKANKGSSSLQHRARKPGRGEGHGKVSGSWQKIQGKSIAEGNKSKDVCFPKCLCCSCRSSPLGHTCFSGHKTTRNLLQTKQKESFHVSRKSY